MTSDRPTDEPAGQALVDAPSGRASTVGGAAGPPADTPVVRTPRASAARPAAVACGVFVLALLLGAAFIHLAETRRGDARRKGAEEAAVLRARRLEAQISRSLSVTTSLAAALQGSLSVERFDTLAGDLLKDHELLQALGLAPGGVVRQLYPHEPHHPLLGRDLLQDPVLGPSARAAANSRLFTLSAPCPLARADLSVLGLLPVIRFDPGGGEQFWGFAFAAVPLRELLASADLYALPGRGFEYQLQEAGARGGRHRILARSTERDLERPVHVEIAVPNGQWSLSLAPPDGWLSPSRLATEMVLVLVLAFWAALSAHRFLREPEKLRGEVERRRRRLAEANRQLKEEVVQRQTAEAAFQRESSHDALTGLPNRTSFSDKLHRAFERGRRQAFKDFVVLFLDLDRFKHVNNSLGPVVGDHLLVAVARRIESSVRPGDVLARVGGDEFAILLLNVHDEEAPSRVAERLLRDFQLPFLVGENEIFATVSIGIATSAVGYERPDELLRDAHTAMYRAKSRGRARSEQFDPSMHDHAAALQRLENDLRHALERGEFLVYYQPIVALTTGRICGSEALIRWRHPERGLIPPMEFLPLAEDTGLVIEMDRWVLAEAARQTRIWQNEHAAYPKLSVSVNLSQKQLAEPALAEHIGRALKDADLDASTLKLEVTESAVMENVKTATEVLSRLREIGAQLLIDDFGTGYSSLSYLQRFPFHTVKIDRSFVTGVHAVQRSAEIVRTIVALAHNLGMEVVAEGVECLEELEHLRGAGCEYGQGYLFSKPIDRDAMDRLLRSEPRW